MLQCRIEKHTQPLEREDLSAGVLVSMLTQQHGGDVHVQSLLGSDLHLQTGRVEAAGGLVLPGQDAGPRLDEGLPA